MIMNKNIIYLIILIFIFFIFFLNYKINKYKKYKILYDDYKKNSISFWLEQTKQYNNITMDIEQINKFNNDIINNVEYVANLSNYDNTINIKKLKKMVLNTNYFNNIPDKKYYNLDNFTEDKIKISYAINTKKTNLRVIPTNIKDFKDSDKLFKYDKIQQKELKYAEPVIVLHYTMDNQWAFIQTNNTYGWVETKYLAFTSKDNFIKYVNTNDFIIVIAKNININDNFVDMGVKLKIKTETKYSYNILLPNKNNKGNLIFTEYNIKKSEDINKGFLPYTRYNVIKQAMKYYNTDYSWGSSDNGVDCSGLVVNVYSVFGFNLPRNSSRQQAAAGKFTLFNENANTLKKNKRLNNTLPGSLLFMEGHIMIYLGKIHNKYFVIHALSSYFENNKTIYQTNVTITTLNLKRSNGNNFKKDILSVTDMEY